MNAHVEEAVGNDAVEQDRTVLVVDAAVAHQHGEIAHIDQNPHQFLVIWPYRRFNPQGQSIECVEQHHV